MRSIGQIKCSILFFCFSFLVFGDSVSKANSCSSSIQATGENRWVDVSKVQTQKPSVRSLLGLSSAESYEKRLLENDVITFYRVSEPYGSFSNLFPAQVLAPLIPPAGSSRLLLWNRQIYYSSSEHYFQSKKFENTVSEGEVRRAETPKQAALMGRERDRPLRSDWENVKESIMFQALVGKFLWSNNHSLASTLMETQGRFLIEHTKNDQYWGDKETGEGSNRLGFQLMDLRDQGLLEDNSIYLILASFLKSKKQSLGDSLIDSLLRLLDGRSDSRSAPSTDSTLKFLGLDSKVILSADSKTEIHSAVFKYTASERGRQELSDFLMKAEESLRSEVLSESWINDRPPVFIPSPAHIGLRSLHHYLNPPTNLFDFSNWRTKPSQVQFSLSKTGLEDPNAILDRDLNESGLDYLVRHYYHP